MSYILLGIFLMIEGAKRQGYTFEDNETVQNICLFIAGLLWVMGYL